MIHRFIWACLAVFFLSLGCLPAQNYSLGDGSKIYFEPGVSAFYVNGVRYDTLIEAINAMDEPVTNISGGGGGGVVTNGINAYKAASSNYFNGYTEFTNRVLFTGTSGLVVSNITAWTEYGKGALWLDYTCRFDTVSNILFGTEGNISLDGYGRKLRDSSEVTSIHWGERELYTSAGAVVGNWESSFLSHPNGNETLKWVDGTLWKTNGAGSKVMDWQIQKFFGIWTNGTEIVGGALTDVAIGGNSSVVIADRIDTTLRRVYDSQGLIMIDWEARTLNDGPNVVVDWGGNQLNDSDQVVSVHWEDRELKYSDGATGSVLWEQSQLRNANGERRLDWEGGELIANDVTTLDWENTQAFSGGGQLSIDWTTRELLDSGGDTALHWASRTLNDDAGLEVLSWESGQLVGTLFQLNLNSGVASVVAGGKLWDTTRKAYNSSDVTTLDWENRTLQGGIWTVSSNLVVRNVVGTVTPMTGVGIDFENSVYQTITLAGDTTFTTASKASGKSCAVKILCDGSTRNLTFPVGWIFVGAAAPTDIAANKTAILSLTCFGSTEADVIAAYAVEP